MRIDPSLLCPPLQSTCDDQGNPVTPRVFPPYPLDGLLPPISLCDNNPTFTMFPDLGCGEKIMTDEESLAERAKNTEICNSSYGIIYDLLREKSDALCYLGNNICSNDGAKFSDHIFQFEQIYKMVSTEINLIFEIYARIISDRYQHLERGEILRKLNDPTNNGGNNSAKKSAALKSLNSSHSKLLEDISTTDRNSLRLDETMRRLKVKLDSASLELWNHIVKQVQLKNEIKEIGVWPSHKNSKSESIGAINFLSLIQYGNSIVKVNLRAVQHCINALRTSWMQKDLEKNISRINVAISEIRNMQAFLWESYVSNPAMQSWVAKNPTIRLNEKAFDFIHKLDLKELDLPCTVYGISETWYVSVSKRLETAFERLEDISRENLRELDRQKKIKTSNHGDGYKVYA